MTNYIDYVVCKHDNSDRPYLFVAPAWSHLEPGDRVIVETKRGRQYAEVCAKLTTNMNPDDATVRMLVTAANATWPLKQIVAKVTVENADWSDYALTDYSRNETDNEEQADDENSENNMEQTEV